LRWLKGKKLTRWNALLLAVFSADLLVFPFLAEAAAAPGRTEVCYSIPDICSVTHVAPIAMPVWPPIALFVLGSELLVLLMLGFSDLPRTPLAPKLAAGVGLGGIGVMMLGSSRALRSVDPALSPFKVYSTFASLFVSNPGQYSDATHLYYGLAVYDVEALFLLALGLYGTFLIYRSRGNAFAVLRSIRVAALLTCVLTIDVAIFDFPEFFIHATSIQEQLHFLPWFTNADLMVVGMSLAGATFLVARGRGRPGIADEPRMEELVSPGSD